MACNSENPATPPGAAEDTHESEQHQTGDIPQPLKRFRFLAAKQANQQQTAEHSSSRPTSESVQSQIIRKQFLGVGILAGETVEM